MIPILQIKRLMCPEINKYYSYQHNKRSNKCVDKKFEGCSNTFFSAPDGRKKINGYQRQLPEKIKQQSIHGQKNAHQPCLAQQHQCIKTVGIFITVVPGRNKYQQKRN